MASRVAAAVLLLLLVAGCTGDAAADRRTQPAPSSAVPSSTAPRAVAAGSCGTVLTGEVPVWARTGFSDGAEVPHVLGERGEIVAVLFGGTLHAPPAPEPANKILWVSRRPIVPLDPLRIEARLGGTGPVVTREVRDGPGPSIVDLPSAGCWSLTLRWSGRTDTMRLAFQPY